MKSAFSKWQRLFLFCAGLAIGSSFAMKWIEPDLVYGGEAISIFGLELFYPKERIISIFSGIEPGVKAILSYHLHFDYVFMAGCFPGIACLCMMAVEKVDRKNIKLLLFILAFAQLLAWVFDLTENYYLLKWLKNPVIGDEFGFYHVVVYSKWIIALSGALIAITILVSSVFKRKKSVS
jgi:hypothetical protein